MIAVSCSLFFTSASIVFLICPIRDCIRPICTCCMTTSRRRARMATTKRSVLSRNRFMGPPLLGANLLQPYDCGSCCDVQDPLSLASRCRTRSSRSRNRCASQRWRLREVVIRRRVAWLHRPIRQPDGPLPRARRSADDEPPGHRSSDSPRRSNRP